MATTSPQPPSPRTLAAVAVGVPAALVLIDHLAWPLDGQGVLSWETRSTLFFPWLVAKTALLSWCAGRFLGANVYGWIVLIWTQAMLDVHTFRASLGNDSTLCQTLVSAQIGFLAVWTILGVTALPWRLTALLLAAAGIILQSQLMDDNWRGESIPFLQTVSALLVAAVCLVLRWSGFRVTPPAGAAPADAAANSARSFQFGVKHMLVWTTALAPLLLVVRGVDVYIVRQLGLADLYPGALVSVSTALVTLATIWLSLGQGAVVLRIVGYVVVVAIASLGLQWQSDQWLAAYRGNWNFRGVMALAIEMGGSHLWGKWFALISALLAGMLLFLRASGYRLTKGGASQSAIEAMRIEAASGGLFD